jgi:predicted PolB exonuclease-like 3'-5' exonuclease
MATTRNALVFDIETVADLTPDNRAAVAALAAQREQMSPEHYGALCPPLARIVCIAWLALDSDRMGAVMDASLCPEAPPPSLSVTDGGAAGEQLRACPLQACDGERALLRAFGMLVERHCQQPNAQLATFNGRGFDLPVLETRALKHGLSLPRYFAAGETRSTYRGSRYSDAYHIDLCDFLSNFGAAYRRNSLNVLAKLIGLPGKYTIAGEDVEYLFRQGRLKEINQYCITDVLQTFLLFLRVELLRGRLDAAGYGEAVTAAREDLTKRASSAGSENFLQEFLQRWKPSE